MAKADARSSDDDLEGRCGGSGDELDEAGTLPFVALTQEIAQNPGLDLVVTAEGGAALTGWATLPAIKKRRSRARITSGGRGCGGHVTSVEVAHYTGGGPNGAYAATERLH